MLFNVRAAKALKAGDHLTVGGAPGLRLEASTRGWAWTYRYKSPIDGGMRQVKLGMWPAISAAQAGVEWEKLKAQRDAGRDPAMEKRQARQAARAATSVSAAERATYLVGNLIDDYAEWAAPKRTPKTSAEMRRTLRTGCDDALRAMLPSEVTRAVAYDTISRIASTPVQAGNLRRELGAAWEWGHDSGRLAETVPNWWRQILRGKLKSKGKIVNGEHQGVSKRHLSRDEVAHVIRLLPKMSTLERDLLTLYLWTGCRGSELVKMEGAELSEVDGVLWWIIPKGKVKMARHELADDLPVPLLGRAREIALRRRSEHGDGFLFPPTRGHAPHVDQKVVGVAVWGHRAGNQVYPEACRFRWGIPDWAPHDLRRTVRTHLSRLGCPAEVAEAVLGHIDVDEDVYDRHDYRPQRLAWLTKLTEDWEHAAKL